MLVQFVVDNFLSFGSRQEFSLFAGKTRAHQDRVEQVQGKSLLKFAALFGANASGKSNLAEAMKFYPQREQWVSYNCLHDWPFAVHGG
jgi:AAA15 family ATPase/GTPase